ncbi:hypothetical protein NSB31_29880 [Bacillus cereus]|nr:hypothetical protein [Bacillus cereus]MCR2013863.1 hypothetical protein [Bacillus cereus]
MRLEMLKKILKNKKNIVIVGAVTGALVIAIAGSVLLTISLM